MPFRRPFDRKGSRCLFLPVGLCLVLAGVSCGKKGPPLPPLSMLPSAPGDLSARRLGSDVVVQFRIPSNTVGGVSPADLARVEVYAHTGALKTPADYVDEGIMVGQVSVKPPAPAEGERPAAPPSAPGAVDQGATGSVSETLPRPFPQALPAPSAPPPVAGTPPPVPSAVGEPPLAPPAAGAPPPVAGAPAPVVLPPMRYYAAVGVTRRGRRGPVSVVAVPFVEPPAPPSGVDAKAEDQGISVGWAPDGMPESLQNPVTYNVYLVPEAVSDTGAAAPPVAPVPLHTAPVSEFSFRHANTEYGRQRCYVVRAVATLAKARIESEPSAPACVTPVDVFPPAPPRALSAVGSGDSISLIWDSNTENDLAGYLVLRGEAPGEKLAPLTPTPIRDTTYRDSAVKRGVSYVYVVRAVDNAVPPNVSESSNRVAEVVR